MKGGIIARSIRGVEVRTFLDHRPPNYGHCDSRLLTQTDTFVVITLHYHLFTHVLGGQRLEEVDEHDDLMSS